MRPCYGDKKQLKSTTGHMQRSMDYEEPLLNEYIYSIAPVPRFQKAS